MRTKAERIALHRAALATKRQNRPTQGSNSTEIVSANKKMYLKVRTDGQELFVPVKPSEE